MPPNPSNHTDHLQRTATTFVDLAHTLVNDFDVIEVLTVLTSRCVELLDAAAAGILLADGDGQLRVIGASTEKINMLELFQIQNDQGPCLDCYTTGEPVIVADLRTTSPWPQFAAECLDAGFPSVCALPLRLTGVTLGCLNLFMTQAVALSTTEVSLAQALADVASITMVQDQAGRESAISRTHLQATFDGRIAIEQAKGMIAESAGIDMDDAFTTLWAYAKQHDRGLTATAELLIAGTLRADDIKSTINPGGFA